MERLSVAQENQAFERWLATRQVAGHIASLRRKTETIRGGEVKQALARLSHLSEKTAVRSMR
ncbi:MAG: hypothetical protein HYX89_07735 [Chloroflexi bacterium]|nr:hypothetical protein [Chloroflexota bacterium]